MTKNITVLVVVIIAIAAASLFIVYFTARYRVLKYSEQLLYSPSGKYILSITKRRGIMAYSSSNKELVLYNRYFMAIGRCIYGEHPLYIKYWDDKVISIVINIRYADDAKLKYIIDWVKANRDIGKYHIKYKIVTPRSTMEY